VGEVEREAAAPLPIAQVEVSASGVPLLPQGPTLTMIDLTFDAPPLTRGSRRRTSRWLMPHISPEPLWRQMVMQRRRLPGGPTSRS
jgi:hypothetical protein